MLDCSKSIIEYFAYQDAIKSKLKNLKDECPMEVLQYLLKRESVTRMNKVIDCSYADVLDKKRYIEYTKFDNCKTLQKFL